MKPILFLLLGMYSLTSLAQFADNTAGNFYLDQNREVIWQRTFPAPYTQQEIKDMLTEAFDEIYFTSQLTLSSEGFSGPAPQVKINNRRGCMLDFISQIEVEIKEEGYKVTISDISFDLVNNDLGENSTQETRLKGNDRDSQSGRYLLSEVVVRKNRNQFRTRPSRQRILIALDEHLSRIFDPGLFYRKENRREAIGGQ
ncbi:hypothetical protein [Robertkochia aurantiaca]|uniref:hypothetical protein n=1 Tax=Robertkochia aurantiaca TaxID=2873700 RepID=UPI001CCF6638|nr:hypothetical protein [Robertkochia sp. 3YJGBD-33]